MKKLLLALVLLSGCTGEADAVLQPAGVYSSPIDVVNDWNGEQALQHVEREYYLVRGDDQVITLWGSHAYKEGGVFVFRESYDLSYMPLTDSPWGLWFHVETSGSWNPVTGGELRYDAQAFDRRGDRWATFSEHYFFGPPTLWPPPEITGNEVPEP